MLICWCGFASQAIVQRYVPKPKPCAVLFCFLIAVCAFARSMGSDVGNVVRVLVCSISIRDHAIIVHNPYSFSLTFDVVLLCSRVSTMNKPRIAGY